MLELEKLRQDVGIEERTRLEFTERHIGRDHAPITSKRL
jgi:hypothetical protein